MSFTLPKLNYASDALVPYITKQTIDFHYGKHHQTYVNNLNNLVPGTPFENASLEQIIRDTDGPIFNNGAQIWNHTFYFESFSPSGQREPGGPLANAISGTFGSFETFKEQFTQSAISLFGSGWAWLVKNAEGRLEIVRESNAGNPLKKGLTPLLTCDVWEHAYYLDYQNRRADYVQAFWNIVDWKVVGSRF